MDILAQRVADASVGATGTPPQHTTDASVGATGRSPLPITLADALAQLATRERYLAIESTGLRYDVGVKYGLLVAQLALALNGRDRDEVLSRLVELLAMRQLGAGVR